MNTVLGINHDKFISNILKKDCFEVKCKPQEFSALKISKSLNEGMYFVKCQSSNADLLLNWQDQGFRVVDLNLQFEGPALSSKNQNAVRLALPQDEGTVCEIASKVFLQNRFHRDLMIESELANNVKKEWVRNYFKGLRGDYLWVYETEKEIKGFLLEIKTENSSIIDLIGVDSDRRKQGIATALIRGLMNKTSKGQVRVGTQAGNIASVRLYESLGFKLRDAYYVFHLHL